MTEPVSLSVPPATIAAFQAFADVNRLRILDALREGERCVCELQEDVGLGQSLLSHHLRALREAGLVTDRREGRWVHYSLALDALVGVEAYLRGLREDAMVAAPRRGSRCSTA